MTQMMEPMLKEFREEVAAPALHLATGPGALARISQLDEFDAAQANFNPPEGEESRRSTPHSTKACGLRRSASAA